MNKIEMPIKLSEDIEREISRRVDDGEFDSPLRLIETALQYYFARHTPSDMAEYVDEELRAGFDGTA